MKLIFSLLVFSFFHYTLAQEIKLVADKWCPYNCSTEGSSQGYVVEMAKAVFKKHKIRVNYLVKPWNEAVKNTEEGTADGVIGALPSDIPAAIFPDEPIGFNNECLFSLKNKNATYQKTEDLKGRKLGIVEGYGYSDEMMEFLAKNKESTVSVSGDNPVKINLENLLNNKIDWFVESSDVVKYTITGRSKYESVVNVGCVKKAPIYVAFSPKLKNAKEFAKILDEGIVQLRQSGELKAILNRYNVQDWK